MIFSLITICYLHIQCTAAFSSLKCRLTKYYINLSPCYLWPAFTFNILRVTMPSFHNENYTLSTLNLNYHRYYIKLTTQ